MPNGGYPSKRETTKRSTVMKCYVCDSDAVAICIVCGMALCKEHVIRKDVDMWEGGYPFPSQKAKKKMPRILCQECSDAMVE